MIEKKLVYHKTSKGSEAIANRQLGLPPKLRSVLILIDGKRGYEELARLAQVLGDADQLLGQLDEQGLIEPLPPAEAAAPAAGTPPLTPGGRPFSLIEARRFASRKLSDILGPSSEPACVKIEAARTARELQAAVKLAEVMVSDVRSSRVAAEFAAAVQVHLPSS